MIIIIIYKYKEEKGWRQWFIEMNSQLKIEERGLVLLEGYFYLPTLFLHTLNTANILGVNNK
ncbi:hypothetical protein COE35_02545 [Priestia megaterium]|uniref:hypothetical protein n=1 Tax=Priestia megaterium TaxID=1404 RepID=UPI000BFE101F|nr:hypothetical protein COE35_02545 [Priestia megaterium]